MSGTKKAFRPIIDALRIIAGILRNFFARFDITLTWRGLAVIGAFCLIIFSFCVIALELLPSSFFAKTTFVATLEAQNLSLRVGETNAVISGVSGTRISLHDLAEEPFDATGQSNDLTQLLETENNKPSSQIIYAKTSNATHLELDSFFIPAGQAMELSTSGKNKFISLQLIEEDSNKQSNATIVWKGQVTSGVNSTPTVQQIGSKRWSAIAPLVQIDGPHIDGLIYSPIDVVGISTDRLRLYGSKQIATSSLLSGDIQFYFGSYPNEPVALRPGEFTKFTNLNAQLANLTLTENGVQFVLVGEASSVKVGFLENLREIHPSLLDGLRSVQSLIIIISSIFALLLAGLSAVSLGKQD
ncbi:hypothetical protein [Pseudovibrio brasiliensis]|uniref:MacB-like periplasmic core domain-containing protein n=1 Tax=Pseudovibrio brasiliensis TaxID=1898042 RepID=A0ABX8AZZ7_9HYPH|nr:hypothetical protein [Pseudovibrio brasiliensis]QUS59154.1 hypothetical protein KGB56_26535 [Pseudovibrio brasiliensis]